jgi:hypothetical protein
MDMSAPTRYQAVRDALFQLGPLATNSEVAEHVKQFSGLDFDNPSTLALYIAMVKQKMSRKGDKANKAPSGMFSFGTPG